MKDNTAEELLAEARNLTDARLAARARRLLQSPGGRDGEALAYALGTAGKRVRAALVLAGYRAAGGMLPGIAAVAAAVEIVHTYSLVHDDLPCMDDDAQRRGRPTTHVGSTFLRRHARDSSWCRWPSKSSWTAPALLGLDPGTSAGWPGCCSRRAGSAGWSAASGSTWKPKDGALDLAEAGRDPRRKTGALIEAACALGALAAGGAGGDGRDAHRDIGREIGSPSRSPTTCSTPPQRRKSWGKTAGRDATLEKATYVSVLGAEGARQEALHHAQAGRAALGEGGVPNDTLLTLAGYIVQRRS